MRLSYLRSLLVYGALRSAVGIVGLLPEPVMRHLGRGAGRLWYWSSPERRRLALRHMVRVGAGRPQQAATEVFASYGRYWAESFWVRASRFDEMSARMIVDGIEHLQRLQQEGSGFILALPHLGNWEAAALIARELDLTVVAVAERLSNPHITRWFTRQREMFGIEVVLTGGGTESRRRLEEALEKGKAVALLCDRDLSRRGVGVEFFGEATTLPAGPARLAIKNEVPVVPVGVYFRAGAGHHAIIHPPLRFSPEKSIKDDVAAATQTLARRLEEIIGVDPAQWHLVRPNWPSDRQ